MATEANTTKRSENVLLRAISGLVIDPYDYIALTYVPSGNGAGNVETATFKQGGASGVTVATITLAYDGSNNVSSITKVP